jgi:DNA repair exonuclease SbcCD ATPase subunit
MHAQVNALQLQLLQAKLGAASGAGIGASPKATKVVADEAISTIQQALASLLSEAESGSDQGQTRADEASRSAAADRQRLGDSITRLEEKNSALQDKVDRLMEEKSALLQKQADMIQLGSDSNSRLYVLQAEAEAAKRDRATFEAASVAKDEELRAARGALEDAKSALRAAEADLDVARSLPPAPAPVCVAQPQPIDICCEEYLALLEEHVGPHRARADALEAELKNVKEEAAAAAAAASASAGERGLRPEELKSLMQDVYEKSCEIFVPPESAGGGTSVSYSPADVVKRLKAVLKSVTQARS